MGSWGLWKKGFYGKENDDYSILFCYALFFIGIGTVPYLHLNSNGSFLPFGTIHVNSHTQLKYVCLGVSSAHLCWVHGEPEGGAVVHPLGDLGHGQHAVPHDLGHLPRRLSNISGQIRWHTHGTVDPDPHFPSWIPPDPHSIDPGGKIFQIKTEKMIENW